jgi:hypothetical protein
VNLASVITWGRRKPSRSDSYELRHGMYHRREVMADRFAAGLGGLVLLVSAQLAAAPPPAIVNAITITLAVFTGAALGLARSGFEYAAIRLTRARLADSGPTDRDALRPGDRRWPDSAEIFYRLSVLLLVATAVSFLVGIWIAV